MKKLALTLVALLTLAPLAPAATLFNGNVTVTSYNSLSGQTDASPHITATRTRTRYGVVAVSRDLVRAYGYHAKLQFVSWKSGNGCNPKAIPTSVRNGIFRIEDTMSPRYSRKVDIWMPNYSQSVNFGHCVAQVRIYK